MRKFSLDENRNVSTDLMSTPLRSLTFGELDVIALNKLPLETWSFDQLLAYTDYRFKLGLLEGAALTELVREMTIHTARWCSEKARQQSSNKNATA